MTRTKTQLQAPADVTESQIDGTYYWPDLDGKIETTNHTHVAVLKQHGYTVLGEVSLLPPTPVRGLIDHDEMGRAGIAEALGDRGLSFPQAATRGELADIAQAWNDSRRRTRLGDRSGAEGAQAQESAQEAPKPARATRAPAEAKPPATPAQGKAEGAFDAETASYDDLKGWLVARGIAFPANRPKSEYREMVEQAMAAKVEPQPQAAAG